MNTESYGQGVHALTLDNFSHTIAAAEQAVVYFSAPWCQPCHQVRPVIQQFAANHPSLALYGEVDVSAASSISQRYGIRSVPVIALFRWGELIAQLPGHAAIAAELEQLLMSSHD
ncbi:MAG: thioredoxin family protein [Paenalcaligenes sp.]